MWKFEGFLSTKQSRDVDVEVELHVPLQEVNPIAVTIYELIRPYLQSSPFGEPFLNIKVRSDFPSKKIS